MALCNINNCEVSMPKAVKNKISGKSARLTVHLDIVIWLEPMLCAWVVGLPINLEGWLFISICLTKCITLKSKI